MTTQSLFKAVCIFRYAIDPVRFPLLKMNHQLQQIILEKLQASEITDIQLIQSLWSGYGELCRLHTDKGSVILKLITFPTQKSHPRGWSSDLGHERKKKSYQVEQHWYANLQAVNGAIMAQCIDSGSYGQQKYLLLEDLQASGFITKTRIEQSEVNQCLKWLAHFHRHFLGHPTEQLWRIGTYWHLDTRPEELSVMTDETLKQSAQSVDERLKRAKYQTIVHGDAKLANFLFNGSQAAAVDFQYVGGGPGIKDVAYFLSSIFYEDELHSQAPHCLDTYFDYLNLPDVESEWRELYPIAWCDFYRFLQGWSPGHWKMNSYSEHMKDIALKSL